MFVSPKFTLQQSGRQAAGCAVKQSGGLAAGWVDHQLGGLTADCVDHHRGTGSRSCCSSYRDWQQVVLIISQGDSQRVLLTISQGDSQHIVIVNTEGLAAGRVYQQLGDWQVAAGCVDHRFRFTQLGPWPWPGRIERLATSSYGVAYKINFGILGTGHLYAWAML